MTAILTEENIDSLTEFASLPLNLDSPEEDVQWMDVFTHGFRNGEILCARLVMNLDCGDQEPMIEDDEMLAAYRSGVNLGEAHLLSMLDVSTS